MATRCVERARELEDMLGLPEGFLRIDDPFLVAQSHEEGVPGGGLGESPTASHPGALALAIEVLQPRQVQAPQAPREDADGQEEVGATRYPTRTIRGQAARGQNTVQVGVMVPWWAPGVEDGEAADLGSEMLGLSGDVLERLGDGVTEQPREEPRVLER
jgi:hypothetical protein